MSIFKNNIRNSLKDGKINIELCNDDIILVSYTPEYRNKIKTYITLKENILTIQEFEDYSVYHFPMILNLDTLKNITAESLFNKYNNPQDKWDFNIAQHNFEHFIQALLPMSTLHSQKLINNWYKNKKNYIKKNLQNYTSWNNFVEINKSELRNFIPKFDDLRPSLNNIGFKNFSKALKHSILLELIYENFKEQGI